MTDAATRLVGVGTFSVEEIVSARIETEAICCRLAAQHRSDEDLGQLAAEIARQGDTALSDEEFCASDVRFHRALATASGNGPLRLMMYAVIESFVPVTNLLIYADHERRRTVESHTHVLEAVSAAMATGRPGRCAITCMTCVPVLTRPLLGAPAAAPPPLHKE